MDKIDVETLFFKVYRNKYLNFKIFEYLDTKDWLCRFKERKTLSLHSYNALYDDRSCKFKFIYDYNWMVERDQHQLLKCKLINNDYIDIVVNPKEIKNTWVKLFSIDHSETIIEVLKLTYKRFEMEINKNINQLIDILLKHSTSIQIINNVLKIFKVVEIGGDDSSLLFKSLISKSIENETNDKTIFYNYFQQISENENIKHQLQQIILELVISKYKQQQQQQQQQQQEPKFKFKLSTLLELKINQTIIQNQLLDLNLIETSGNSFNSDIIPFIINLFKQEHNETKSNLIESLLVYSKIYKLKQYKIQLLNPSTTNIKELLKQLIISTESIILYEFYLSRYQEPIEELMKSSELFNDKTIKYCLENYNFNILNSSLNWEMIYQFKKEKNSISIKDGPLNLEESIKYLKLYLSILPNLDSEIYNSTNMDLDKYTAFIIVKVMFKIDNSELYQSIYQNVIPLKYQNYIPSTWNSIQLDFDDKNKLIIVKDKETIDWIKNCYEIFGSDLTDKFPIFSKRQSFEYNSFELAVYAEKQLSGFPPTPGLKSIYIRDFYLYPLVKAIKDCDFKTVEKIVPLFEWYYNDPKKSILSLLNSKSLSEIQFNSNATIEQYNQLFNYLANCQLKLFSDKEFLMYIVYNGYYNDCEDNKDNSFFNLSNIKLNLNESNASIHSYSSITNIKSERFISENLTWSRQITNFEIYINYSKLSDCSELIKLIKIYVNKFNKCKQIINGSNNGYGYCNGEDTFITDLPNLKQYSKIINKLFQIFISNCNSSEFNQINSIYQLIQDNEITFDLNLIPLLLKTRFPILQVYVFNVSNIDYLKSNISFEMAMNDSFNKLLSCMVYDDNSRSPYNFYNLNRACIFFLKVDRIDLFFNQLQSIKFTSKLEKTLINQICRKFDIDSLKLFIQLGDDGIGTNLNYLYSIAILLVKLDRMDIFDYLFNQHLIKLDNSRINFTNYTNLSKIELISKLNSNIEMVNGKIMEYNVFLE